MTGTLRDMVRVVFVDRRTLIIRALGVAIMAFALAHLFLNLYIIIAPYILKAGQLQKVIAALSRVLGSIAVRGDSNQVILCVKVAASALFLITGIGIVKLKEWSRNLLFYMLGLRIMYGFTICAVSNIFHPHLIIILLEGLSLYYYFTRPIVTGQFK